LQLAALDYNSSYSSAIEEGASEYVAFPPSRSANMIVQEQFVEVEESSFFSTQLAISSIITRKHEMMMLELYKPTDWSF